MHYSTKFLFNKLIVENGFKVSLRRDQIASRICRFLLFIIVPGKRAVRYSYRYSIRYSLVFIFFLYKDKAKSLFNCGTRMEKALQRLAEANLTSKSKSPSSTQDSTTQTTEDGIPKVNIAIDTPPNTPSTQTDHLSTLFKGIPKALLEKVRIITLTFNSS